MSLGFSYIYKVSAIFSNFLVTIINCNVDKSMWILSFTCIDWNEWNASMKLIKSNILVDKILNSQLRDIPQIDWMYTQI